MLKLAGAAIIFSASLSIGFIKAFRLKKRCDSLHKLMLATERIGAEISFTQKRLERIFNEAARDFSLPLFSDIAVMMLKTGVRHAFDRSIIKYADDMALTKTDIKAAKTLSAIGDYSGIEQKKLIDTTLRLLELSHREAVDSYNKSGKLYRSSGVLIGLLGIILLF